MRHTIIMSLSEARERFRGFQLSECLTPLSELRIGVNSAKEVSIVVERLGERRLLVSPGALKGLRQLAGVGRRLPTRSCSDSDLFQKVLNRAFQERAETEAFLVYMPGWVVSVSSGRSSRFRPEWLFDMAKEERLDMVQKMGFTRQGHFEVRFIGNFAEGPPEQPDDLSHSGIWVKLNESAHIAPYLLRQVCQNGLLGEMSEVRRADSRAGLQHAVRENVLAARGALKRLVSLTTESVKEPSEVFFRIAEEFSATDRLKKKVVAQLPSLHSPVTTYDLINLVTQQGNLLQDAAFERLGGAMLRKFTAGRS